MGLGKTVQSIGLIDHIFRKEKLAGPYLVIVPLSTIVNWVREFEMWTDMNVVSFLGNAESRRVFKENEMDGKKPKFDVIVTTYEMIGMEHEYFASTFAFRLMIVDEAHRLKSSRSKTLAKIRSLTFGGILLLTGTPLQNKVKELWPLLNLLDPEAFDDEDEFEGDYEHDFESMEKKQSEGAVTVKPLIQLLYNYMLRRMKNHVEHTLKPKMEIVVEVDLTTVRTYAEDLQLHKSLSIPNLSNEHHNPHTDPEKILPSSVSRQRQRSLARIQEEHEQYRDAATKVL